MVHGMIGEQTYFTLSSQLNSHLVRGVMAIHDLNSLNSLF